MKFNIFELGIVSFSSYVYFLTRGFIASTRAFNLLSRAFNLPTGAFSLPTRAFNLATRAFSILTRGFELVTRGFELVTRRFEIVTRGFELVTRGFELVTCNLRFTFPLYFLLFSLSLNVTFTFLLLCHFGLASLLWFYGSVFSNTFFIKHCNL